MSINFVVNVGTTIYITYVINFTLRRFGFSEPSSTFSLMRIYKFGSIFNSYYKYKFLNISHLTDCDVSNESHHQYRNIFKLHTYTEISLTVKDIILIKWERTAYSHTAMFNQSLRYCEWLRIYSRKFEICHFDFSILVLLAIMIQNNNRIGRYNYGTINV